MIRLTFVPFAGSNSYRVTVGPCVAFTTFAVIPKLSNVSSNKTALCATSSLVTGLDFPCESIVNGGYW